MPAQDTDSRRAQPSVRQGVQQARRQGRLLVGTTIERVPTADNFPDTVREVLLAAILREHVHSRGYQTWRWHRQHADSPEQGAVTLIHWVHDLPLAVYSKLRGEGANTARLPQEWCTLDVAWRPSEALWGPPATGHNAVLLEVLWTDQTSFARSGRIPARTRQGPDPGQPPRRVCIEGAHRDAIELQQHRVRTVGSRAWCREIPPLPLLTDFHSDHRSQATGDNLSQTPSQSPTEAPATHAQNTRVPLPHRVPTGPRHAARGRSQSHAKPGEQRGNCARSARGWHWHVFDQLCTAKTTAAVWRDQSRLSSARAQTCDQHRMAWNYQGTSHWPATILVIPWRAVHGIRSHMQGTSNRHPGQHEGRDPEKTPLGAPGHQ